MMKLAIWLGIMCVYLELRDITEILKQILEAVR